VSKMKVLIGAVRDPWFWIFSAMFPGWLWLLILYLDQPSEIFIFVLVVTAWSITGLLSAFFSLMVVMSILDDLAAVRKKEKGGMR